jgi:hypothetical protein
MTSTRGVYGRRRPKGGPALRAAQFLTGAVPAHPPAEDWIGALGGGWGMLGNDRAGDCVAVTWASFRRLVTTLLTAHGLYPDQDMVWRVYRTQNPDFDPAGDPDVNGPGSPADQGMDIQTVLEYLHKTGGPDGVKAVAFASVNPQDQNEVDAALAIFGGLWTGLIVTRANEDEFDQGKPWDYVARSPEAGGHSVLSAGYSPAGQGAGPLAGRVRFQTWAAESSFTAAMMAHQVEEMWLVIWPENLGTAQFQEGVDTDALKAAYLALTGKVLVIPAPVVPALPAAVADFLREAGSQPGGWAHTNRTRTDLAPLKAGILDLEAAARAAGIDWA